MQIDYDYLKEILEAFAAAPKPTTDIEELKRRGIDYKTDQFLFHMEILQDKAFIEQPDNGAGIGVQRSIDGYVSWGAVPLRLTATGHEFLDGMRNEQAMVVVKRDFKHAGIATVKAVFKAALDESAKLAVRALLTGGHNT
jgi:hypothetical protein